MLRGVSHVGKIVIYTRYSSEMQRNESCADQERKVREGLARVGIDGSIAEVIRDEAVSGTKEDRNGFTRLSEMVYAGQVGILAVDDQSRLSRGINVKAFVTDLVFHKGRFISVGENIDTAKEGWEFMVGMMELHHSTSSKETGRRVRRGIEGRFLDNGAAGAFPYGYRSEFIDEDWAIKLAARQKPKKRYVIYEPEAAVVREIFTRFAVDKWSMNSIAADLNRRGVSTGLKSTLSRWCRERISRFLRNRRYIGRWAWGETEYLKDSRGKRRCQVAVRQKPVVSLRPDLRIIDDHLWQLAEQRRQEVTTNRNVIHPRHIAPSRNILGLFHCGVCGKLLRHKVYSEHRYLWCSNSQSGFCSNRRLVPVENAENAILRFLQEICGSWPDWLSLVKQEMRNTLQSVNTTVLSELTTMRLKYTEISRQVENVVDKLSNLPGRAPTLEDKLVQLENEKQAAELRIQELEAMPTKPIMLPSDEWITARLANLPVLLSEPSPAMSLLLRQIFHNPVVKERPRPVFKTPSLIIEFGINPRELLISALGAEWRTRLSRWLPKSSDTAAGSSPRFTLDVSSPIPAEEWASTVGPMRESGATWPQIEAKTGLSRRTVMKANDYWTQTRVA